MGEKHFLSCVFDYGTSKENCLSFGNIHMTEHKKETVRKAWEDVCKAIRRCASNETLDKVALKHYTEFMD